MRGNKIAIISEGKDFLLGLLVLSPIPKKIRTYTNCFKAIPNAVCEILVDDLLS